MTRRALLLVLLAFGCDAGETEPAPVEPPSGPCAAGERQRPDGACVAAGLPPDLACAPGQWQRPDGACEAAGVPLDGCGAGFLHGLDGGCAAVLPPAPCEPGFMAVPGETTCRRVSACAAGTWGDIPVEADTEYVDAGYLNGGSDGSAAQPWTTLAEGIEAAAEGAIVAIAEGTYAEDVLLIGKRVRLWGVCPDRVAITGTGGQIAKLRIFGGAGGSEVHQLALSGEGIGVVVTGSTDVLLERLWVHDNDGRGVNVQNDAGATSVTLRGVLIEDNRDVGLFLGASAVTVEGSVIRTTGFPGDGRGIAAQSHPGTGLPATLTLRGSLIEANHDAGVYVSGSNATIDTTVVRATGANADGVQGRGIWVNSDAAPASLSLATSVVDGNREVGVLVTGASATIESTVVRATVADVEGIGRGIDVTAGYGFPATLTLRTSLVDLNSDVGVHLAGATATIDGTIVRGTISAPPGSSGRGVNVQVDATNPAAPGSLTMTGTLIEHNQDTGVSVSGSSAIIERCVIRDNFPNSDGVRGRGITAFDHAMTHAPSRLEVRASLIERNHEIGVLVSGSNAILEDTVIRATLPEVPGNPAVGLWAQHNTLLAGSTLTLTGVLVEESQWAGVFILGSTATIAASRIRGTTAAVDGSFGEGIVTLAGLDATPANASISDTAVEASARAAIAAWGSTVTLGGSSLYCQTFDIDFETYQGTPASLDDLGGNRCGCPEATATCEGVTAGLQPPPLPTAPE